MRGICSRSWHLLPAHRLRPTLRQYVAGMGNIRHLVQELLGLPMLQDVHLLLVDRVGQEVRAVLRVRERRLVGRFKTKNNLSSAS